MPWTRELAKSIVLRDGRTITTLAEARAIMRSLPEARQHKEPWLYAGGLLLEAATGRAAMAAVEAQLTRALKTEGLI